MNIEIETEKERRSDKKLKERYTAYARLQKRMQDKYKEKGEKK